MLKNLFKKLNKEGKLLLTEQSDTISYAYSKKSEDCINSSNLLFQNKFYENSIILSYYSMYNASLSLFSKLGIRSKNHNATVLLLKYLLNREDLFNLISFAKKERIHKQYYPVSGEKEDITAKETIIKSRVFSNQIEFLITNLNEDDIRNIRSNFKKLF